jgi:nitrate reductase gamma subunit
LGKTYSYGVENCFWTNKNISFPICRIIARPHILGFLVILFGSIEMVIDGIFGLHKSLQFLGVFYDILMAFIDVFAFIIAIAIIVFIIRRISHKVKRFDGREMTSKAHKDAFLALTLIFLLMFSLLGMNSMEAIMNPQNPYPVSNFLGSIMPFCPCKAEGLYSFFWWMHIELIFIFANILPYSKHFHIFMSIPNVFLSRLEPLGKLNTMESITKELQLMMNPETAYAPQENAEPVRFGIKDAEEVTWKTYLDSLTCTQCGRCTSVCPAAQTGQTFAP